MPGMPFGAGAETTGDRPMIQGITFRQLLAFEAVGRCNSMTRAARECRYSEPAATLSIRKLEKSVGVPLLKRKTTGTFLNPAGEVFYARTERCIRQVESALVETLGQPTRRSPRATIALIGQSHLRSLLGIFECGSFEQASVRAGVSRQAIEKNIHTLEYHLGCRLACRAGEQRLMTSDGVRLAKLLKLALQEVECAILEVRSSQGTTRGSLVIGAMPQGGSMLLATALEPFLAKNRNIDIRIVCENAPSLLRGLAKGDVDFVVGLWPDHCSGELVFEPFGETPYRVACRPDHPLIAGGKSPTAALADFEWVIGSAGSSRRAHFDQLFSGLARPKSSIETSSVALIEQLLLVSDRLSLMTKYELSALDGSLHSFPLASIAPAPQLGLISRSGWQPTTRHSALIDLLRLSTNRELMSVQ